MEGPISKLPRIETIGEGVLYLIDGNHVQEDAMEDDNERTEDSIQTDCTTNQDKETAEEPSQNLEPVKLPSLKFIKVMLLLIAIGTLWLGLQTSSRVLVVEINTSVSLDSEASGWAKLLSGETSDRTQVRNALRNGGLIKLGNSSESYASLLGSDYYSYGARDSDNYFFISGAALNYIASQGWTLVQAPESGTVGTYYFVRKRPKIMILFDEIWNQV